MIFVFDREIAYCRNGGIAMVPDPAALELYKRWRQAYVQWPQLCGAGKDFLGLVVKLILSRRESMARPVWQNPWRASSDLLPYSPNGSLINC